MSTAVTQISLPNGTPVWARISDAEQLGQPSSPGGSGAAGAGLGYADTGLADRAAARVESLRGLLTGIATTVADGLRPARPDEVSVTFGVELAARAGKVVGLLTDGETKAALTITLTWHGAPPDDPGQTT